MGQLQNSFSWSASRDRLFRSCPRAYYYNYYGYWNGWSAYADERVKLIYELKKIQGIHLWAGSIVHDTIKDALENYRDANIAICENDLINAARIRLRRGWVQSTQKEWVRDKKKLNLFELYYGNGKTLPKEMTEKIKYKVNSALSAFASSEILERILSVPCSNWKPIDELNYYMLDDIKVWCAIDFSYVDNEGYLHIVDWKTGKEKVDELHLQLAGYCFFAHDSWGFNTDKIKTCGIFLNEDARISNYQVEEGEILKARDYILESRREMYSLLDNIESNKASEKNFCTKPEEYKCSTCNFRKICETAI